jgi:hypothetical protein
VSGLLGVSAHDDEVMRVLLVRDAQVVMDRVRALDARRSRVHLRFRIAGVRRVWLVRSGRELLDLLTVAGLAAGLRERVSR